MEIPLLWSSAIGARLQQFLSFILGMQLNFQHGFSLTVSGFGLTQFKCSLCSSFLCFPPCPLVMYVCCGSASTSLSSAKQAQPHCCKVPLSPGSDNALALFYGVNGTPFTFRWELHVDLSRVSPFPRPHSPSPSCLGSCPQLPEALHSSQPLSCSAQSCYTVVVLGLLVVVLVWRIWSSLSGAGFLFQGSAKKFTRDTTDLWYISNTACGCLRPTLFLRQWKCIEMGVERREFHCI